MRLLTISNMYPTPQWPGYGVFVKNFVTSLEEEGHEVDLSAIHGKSSSRLGKIKKYVKMTLSIYSNLATKKYDLIYVHFGSHSLLPFLPIYIFLKTPMVVNFHGEDLLPRSTTEKIISKFTKPIIQKARLIVVPSYFFRDIASERYPDSTIFISPSGGVNTRVFKPGKELDWSGKPINYGFISRIDEGKGWQCFLKAMCILKSEYNYKKFKATIIGNGDQASMLEAEITKLGLKDLVTYQGPLPHHSLASAIQDFTFFVFPTELPESLGLVAIEAMACGIPVIGSNTGATSEYIDEGVNGYTFSKGDAEELAKKLNTATTLPTAELRKLSLGALSTAKRYDANITSELLISKLEEIVENRS
ncbi:MAG: GlcNAc transferase [Pseudomonadales bacterium]|nr:GlcNAc transferase [Pseudomonadales bacterium]|tara:strand:- start:403 stop:1485 length:1083 start_codon:yes stop_codon:yes gene_type:complete